VLARVRLVGRQGLVFTVYDLGFSARTSAPGREAGFTVYDLGFSV
jgi:hypothetical protein